MKHDELEAEYSHKVAGQKPRREDPAQIRAQLDAALAKAAELERRASEQARKPIEDPQELERAARRLQRKLRG